MTYREEKDTVSRVGRKEKDTIMRQSAMHCWGEVIHKPANLRSDPATCDVTIRRCLRISIQLSTQLYHILCTDI
eukprot:scaffold3543_cov90-Skeletonema_dohrnii-CCMP3373.AAC.5